jgi:hypothetical protein
MFINMYAMCYSVHVNEHKRIFMRAISPLAIPLKRALRKLGQDIRDARLRRRIPGFNG